MAQRPVEREAMPSAAAQAGEEPPSRRRWAVLSVLAAVAFMAQLDLFIVNVALPAMARSFQHAPLSDLSWVLNDTATTSAASASCCWEWPPSPPAPRSARPLP